MTSISTLSRTAADEYASAEISGLTSRAALAAQAFQETVQQVTLAAAVLEHGSHAASSLPPAAASGRTAESPAP